LLKVLLEEIEVQVIRLETKSHRVKRIFYSKINFPGSYKR